MFSELTECEICNSSTLKPIIQLVLHLLLGEVETLEFIEERNISEMTVFTAGD